MLLKGRYKYIFLLLILFLSVQVEAQDFGQFFKNKTLRLDYIFGGNNKKQIILLDEMVSYPQWAGRTHHLTENALRGNGQIHVYDAQSNQLIYTKSFSTLFQEWLSTEEATKVSRSFENVFLVPFPKNKARIEVILYDNLGNEKVTSIQNFNPNDILIHEKGVNNVTPYEYVHKAKDQKRAINIAFVAEG